jgi:hypothetical protein
LTLQFLVVTQVQQVQQVQLGLQTCLLFLAQQLALLDLAHL